ncbi:cupin domain-containing protein [Phenylobacterium sp.]|uniref:cupin domain-containing protein n=1 Tax=Phenylobacterium sp. TaxID=1871053 RepID=UPI00121CBBE2|nr:cupin domain-containing protein [Phenylobacterium sp.]THD60494.1 MAG: cupin domain-containing protein [Phenylobacterium sp.]
MPKIDIEAVPLAKGSLYPAPYDEPCRERQRQRLGNAVGLDQFGVNLLTLPPGAWSAQRHWHAAEDEFVYILEGEVVLVDDGGEQVLRAGDCAGFKAGVANGHHLVNRSDRDARLLEVGTRSADGADPVDYPDIDMIVPLGSDDYHHRDGTPYPVKPR